MNREIAIGHWHEWKGAMRERWGRLTDDEWQQIQGDREQLLGALERHYGYTREQADAEVDAFVDRHTAVTLAPPAVDSTFPEDALGAMPVEQRVLPYTNDAGYVRDAAVSTSEALAVERDANRAAGLPDPVRSDVPATEVRRRAAGSRVDVRRDTDATDPAIDNGVRAQPGDVLGLDTGGETTSLGDTATDEDRRRVDALENAPPLSDDERPR